jgi:hypothetical protein
VAVVEHEPVRAPGVLRGGVAPLAVVVVVLRRGHGTPPDCGASELIGDLLAVAHGEREPAGAVADAPALGEPQRPRPAGAPGAEVRRGVLVRVPAPHPVAAAVLGDGDDEVRVQEPREAEREAAQGGEAAGEEAARQQLAREVAAQHVPREHYCARERRPEAAEPLQHPGWRGGRRRQDPRRGSWARRHAWVSGWRTARALVLCVAGGEQWRS